MEITYTVYSHIFRTTMKPYIGITSLGIETRLHKHFLNACSGQDTHFYRAIRKYGMSDIISKILWQGTDRNKALAMEKHFIKEFNSIKDGYNCNEGGSGGSVCLFLSEEKRKVFIQKCKIRSHGQSNPKFCGLSDNQLIDIAVQFYQNKGYFILRHWLKYSKDNNLPQTYSLFRFNGKSYNGFLDALKIKLKELNIYSENAFDYKKTPEYIARNIKISNTLKNAKNNKTS